MTDKTKVLFLSLVLFVAFSNAQSKVEFTSILKEKFIDKSGQPLTGKGVVVGDVDSGIDVFHPMFFFADGGDFNWVDVNENGKFDAGVDGVDFDGDSKAGDTELLRLLELRDNTYNMLPGYNPKKFDTYYDFLYMDKNKSQRREHGTKDGFTESDPSYGEQLFIARDENGNGVLDKGEKISALKTSKVKSVFQRNGVIRRRGIDMIQCEADSNGHGTGVNGLILGGHYGVQKNHGFAPDAEIVIASVAYSYTPRFVRNFPELISFLRDEKVNILLFEDGEWMHEFMDGSSPEEEMVNEMARNGTTIIGGAGNFTGAKMMVMDELKSGESRTYKADCPNMAEEHLNNGVFFSFLWTEKDKNLSFVIETPDKQKSDELTSGSGKTKVGNYNIFYTREVSPKGTVMMRFSCSKTDSGSVKGTWNINVKAKDDLKFRGYVVDISQSWAGTSHWLSDKISDESTIMFPSTADSCIAVGGYVVNFGWFDVIGDLATYSSKGYNITGKLGVDICGPAHTTLTTEKDFGWMTFSGTSSAAPHVVGTAALMLQYDPTLTHAQIRQIINSSATSDKFTGSLPNANWGYGKLNPEGAIKYLMNNPIN